ncbi:hypothetical protein P4E94_09475 [Pontiellaceae bacterium B12219]|nr:hypothetical protein [Pontiellaceae bacterium B12219]
MKKCLVVLLILSGVVSGYATWMTQTVQLDAGWNAVWLTIQPVPSSCDTVFANADVDCVQLWARQTGGEEFSTDPMEVLDRAADWQIWRPKSHPDALLNDLENLVAGKAYLIHATAAVSLELSGRAQLVEPDWLANSMSLTGLPAKEGTSFSDFLKYTDEVGVDSSDGGSIYEVLSTGNHLKVYMPGDTAIVPGTAYWIKTLNEFDYAGPVSVKLQADTKELDFGSTWTSRNLTLINHSDVEQTVTLRQLPAEPAPISTVPGALGVVPLGLERYNPATARREISPMPDVLTTNLAPEGVVELALRPRADELVSGELDVVWESLLQIDTPSGILQTIGICCSQDERRINTAGLWVGYAVVNKVSRAPSRIGADNAWDAEQPVDVSEPYKFRVLIHVDASGTPRLLQRVFPCLAGGDDAEINRLYTRAEAAEQFHDDYPDSAVSCIASANFPLMDPVELTGYFAVNQTMSGQVTLPFDDRVNPFVHPYHPDHDNKTYENSEAAPLGEGDESFTVTRDLSFTISAEDPRGDNPLWMMDETGGEFRETVNGVNKTLYVAGAFYLKRVSNIDALQP